MNKQLKIGLATLLMLGISACSTTKEIQQVAEVPAPVERETVTVVPAPTKPVVQAPIVQPAPGPAAPTAGTAAHFKYMAGDDRVYFGYNEYSLSTQSQNVLRQQAEWLKTYGNAIVVVAGNADERGTREYNLALGARRASAAKAFLIAQGIAPKRVTTISYGKERPINGGSNEAAWAMNRNAHSSVLVGDRS